MEPFETLANARGWVRSILGDTQSPYRHTDQAVDDVLRITLRFGELPGYELSPDATKVVPAITDPGLLGLFLYKAALKLAAPHAAAHSYRTRAFSEAQGEQRALLHELYMAIQQHEPSLEAFARFYDYLAARTGQAVNPANANM